MGLQSNFRSLCRQLVSVVLVLMLGHQWGAFAQQIYQGDTYSCSNTLKTSCDAFALYRAQADYADLTTIGALFNLKGSDLTVLNNGVGVNKTLTMGYPVLVPLTCICFNKTSYANLTYQIQNGDTFYDVNVNNFESLSTTTAVVNANPTDDYTDLEIGEYVIFPLRCACPSVSQVASGVTSLVTYPVIAGDAVGEVAASFGVPMQSVISANELVGANQQIEGQTTLLIPINTTDPTYSQVATLPPAPSTIPPAAPASSHGSSSKTGLYVGIAVGASAGVVLFIVVVVCCFLALKRRKSPKKDTEAPVVLRRSDNRGNDPGKTLSDSSAREALAADPLSGMSDLVGSDKPTLFTYDELCEATNNFSDNNVVQGSVYQGILKGRMVAIKQMKGEVSQELRILCRVHHSNLIKLVGLCAKEAEHLYLVYEYAENGSLSDCLHTDFLAQNKLSTKSSSFLSWTMRVQIALDAASGLEYIHDYTSPSYVHKDVKSSNILLDTAFRAKIANFAMAKSDGGSNDMMTRHIAGTYGYMAPEYLQHGLVSTKADVFSFGVVLLELLSGDEAISEGVEGEEKCLYSVIRPILESPDSESSLKRWMDPVLSDNYPFDTAMSMAKLAKSCVDSDPRLRPSMKDIAFSLSNCLSASLEWETSAVFASTLADTPIEAR